MSKRVQKVWNAVTTVLVILVVILALLLVGVRLVGLRPMCVLSGSMEPTYHTGSLIYVKPCAPEDVQVGDAITFVLNEDLDVVTHRVISIDAENEHFYTQGDANDAPDGAPVYFKNLIGRPVFTIPYLGYVSHWVSNPPGMYLAIALALVLIILTFLPDMGSAKRRRRTRATLPAVHRRTNPAMPRMPKIPAKIWGNNGFVKYFRPFVH